MADDISAAVGEVTRHARSTPAAMSEATKMAHGLVRSLYEDGRLNEHEVVKFARDNKFDETNAALACLANVNVMLAETLMLESHTEGILILAKVATMSWSTVQSIIDMRSNILGEIHGDVEENRLTYERLRVSTAQQVLRFHKMQESTPKAVRA